MSPSVLLLPVVAALPGRYLFCSPVSARRVLRLDTLAARLALSGALTARASLAHKRRAKTLANVTGKLLNDATRPRTPPPGSNPLRSPSASASTNSEGGYSIISRMLGGKAPAAKLGSMRDAAIVVVGAGHWRRWAARRARQK